MMNSVENNVIDRISSLPDEARTYILSFLSTREAVQTCILSKRWINTWVFVPDLKFDIKEFGLPPNIVDGKMAIKFVTKFQLFVKSVLEKRETSCVNRFQLSLDSRVYWPHTQAIVDCIGDVMKLEPRECLVEMGSCENLKFITDLIFTCGSLIHVQLCLSNKESIPLVAIEPNFVNLPRLKTLVLNDVIMSDDFFKKLFSGCPMLQELVLERCYLKNIIKICSNTLKKLVLRECCDVRGLQIFTPNLVYLDMKVIGIGEILLLNMSSLVDASNYIPSWGKYLTRGAILLLNIPNVEYLRLQFIYLDRKPQIKDFSNSSVFNNLKRLELVNSGFFDFDLPSFFLHHSPKLQELTLTNIDVWRVKRYVDQHAITQEGLSNPLVQREFLKTVRIVGFEDDNEFADRLIKKLHAHVKIISEIIV